MKERTFGELIQHLAYMIIGLTLTVMLLLEIVNGNIDKHIMLVSILIIVEIQVAKMEIIWKIEGKN